jgi:hypothetical protein
MRVLLFQIYVGHLLCTVVQSPHIHYSVYVNIYTFPAFFRKILSSDILLYGFAPDPVKLLLFCLFSLNWGN